MRQGSTGLALRVCALGGVFVVCLRVGASAQAPAAARTALEDEAYGLYEREQWVTARTKAEQVLAQDSRSMVGHFVLGVAMHRGEGSLARAMFHLGRARELYETTWSAVSRPASAPFELHRETLYRIQSLSGEMELFDYQLQVLGYHDYLYDPDLLAQHAWPLMRLGRFDEAREFARLAVEQGEDWQRSTGLNALCAVEGEAGTREPYLEACMAALRNARERQDGDEPGPLAVHAYNAALAARAAFRFDQAQQLAVEGARRLEFTTANPWRFLVRLYVDQGKLTSAVEALREMQRWRRRQPAFLRDQDRAETDSVLATLLLLAGRTRLAEQAIDRAIEQPDRRGFTSSSPEQALGAHALVRRALIVTRAEQLAEDGSARGLWGRVAGWFEATWARWGAFGDDERIAAVLGDGRTLVRTLRPYVSGGLEPLPPWLVGDLVQVVGPGIVSVALERARRIEGDGSPAAPYHDALQAEVRLAQGEERGAYALARRALETLPASEALLRARVAAVGAEAARGCGRTQDALELYEMAMQLDPSVLRRLGLSLPATVRYQGGGQLGREVAARIEGSPRLRSARGFEVVVSGAGSVVRACLLSVHRARLGCAEVDPRQLTEAHAVALRRYEEQTRPAGGGPRDQQAGEPPEAPEPVDPIEHLAREFHRRVFSAPIVLSSADLGSLDGTTTTGAEVARERMRRLLDDAIDPGR